MNSLVIVNDLMKRVNRAFHNASQKRLNTRSYSTARLYVPGFASKLTIPGVDVQDLLVPDTSIEEPARVESLTEALAYINDEVVTVEARRQLTTLFGYKVVAFVLVCKSPGQRVARLIWALGKGYESEVGETTLVIKSPSGDYGVRDGLLVGGPYAGYAQVIDTTQITEVERIVTTRSRFLIEANTVLRCRNDPSAYHILCLLYSRSEWDSKVLLKTVLTYRPRMSRVNFQEIASKIMTEDDPYQYLFRKLVPFCMPYTDFVACFSNPVKRGDIRTSARLSLSRKLYDLPFFE